MRPRVPPLVGLVLAACLTLQSACLANLEAPGSGGQLGDGPSGPGGTDAGGDGDTDKTPSGGGAMAPVYPFEAVSQGSAVRKIKTLITGLAPTDAELAQGADSAGLEALSDAWLKSPQSDRALMDFMMWSLQLSQMTPDQAFEQQAQNHPPGYGVPEMIRESMARTAMDIVRNGRPFTEIATTTSYMVTPQLLYWMIIVDGQGGKDIGRLPEYETQLDPNFHYTLVDNANIPMERSGNPADPDYMVWSTAPLSTNCNFVVNHSFTVDKNTYSGQVAFGLWLHLQGRTYTNADGVLKQGACQVLHPANVNRLEGPEFFKWRMVKFRQPRAAERSTPFWNFDALLNANEIVLRIPRVGYYTHPAFLAQAPTNINNQARVTVNQALIVGLNQDFDGSDQTQPASTAALTPEHAKPGTSCYGCHITMDPMRQFFRQALSVNSHVQTDPNQMKLPGVWAHDGRSEIGTGIADFGRFISESPSFPGAWVQKACTWINSAPCSKNDPELKAIAERFKASRFDFLAMFKEVLLSNATTYRASSVTATANDTVMSMARRQNICRLFASRLGITDPCGLQYGTSLPGSLGAFAQLMRQYPADSYARAAVRPDMATLPSVPVRTSLEFACGHLAQHLIDSGSATKWSSSNPKAVAQDLATGLMGVPSSEAGPVVDILVKHVADARTSGLSATDAMRSGFVLACLSPQVVNLGAY